VPPYPEAIRWIFLNAAIALGIILFALGAALVLSQRRLLATHRQYAERLLEAQEQERAWVAREVHDDALQRIALLGQELRDLTETAEPETGDVDLSRVEAVREEIEDLGVMLRRLAHRLHPSVIDQAGLVPALQALAMEVARVNQLQVDITDEIAHPYQLSRERALLLYRIAQEAVRNVVKHAGVKQAMVRVKVRNGTLEMVVRDEGPGFLPDGLMQRQGLGLTSMKERARLANGQIEVLTAPGGGTSIRVVVPLTAD
jgi:signal transduction histidine kinase